MVGAPDPDLGEQVVAVMVPEGRPDPAAAMIAAFCRERLASYKKPRRVVFVDALPRNALGKVQKHLLTGIVDPTIAGAEVDTPAPPPYHIVRKTNERARRAIPASS